MRRLPRLSQIKKVVIVRIDHIGDLLCSTPAIRSLREGLPAATLTLVASPDNHAVVENWDCLDNVVVFDPNWPLQRKRLFARVLGREGFELCVILSAKAAAYYLAWRAGIPTRAGLLYAEHVIPRLLRPLLLTHAVVMSPDRALRRGQTVLHEATQALRVVERLGIPATEGPLEVVVKEDDVKWASSELSGIGPAGRLVGFHLSPKWLTQGWTSSNLRSLIDGILETIPGCTILLTYGPWDTQTVAVLAQRPGQAGNARPPTEQNAARGLRESFQGRVFVMGGVPFRRWAALLSLCRVVISHDTGSLHLASALRKPVVAVYNARDFQRNSRQFAPWKVPNRIIRMDRFESTCRAILEAAAGLWEERRRQGFDHGE